MHMQPTADVCGMAPYRGVAHIDSVQPYSADADGDLMLELGRILCDARMQEWLGIALLHGHFPLGEREYWLERYEDDLVVSRPVELGALECVMHPMIWRMTPKEGAVPMHWRMGTDLHADAIAAFLRQTAPRFLDVLGDEASRFGIVRAPEYPEFATGSVLRERTYSDRALVSAWDEAIAASDVQTTWYFRAAAQQGCIPIERTFCTQFCTPIDKERHAPGHQSTPLPAGHES